MAHKELKQRLMSLRGTGSHFKPALLEFDQETRDLLGEYMETLTEVHESIGIKAVPTQAFAINRALKVALNKA